MVKVLLADNHAVARRSILRLLADDPRVEVVGEAADFSQAIAQVHDIRTEVLILDLDMPFGSGLSINHLRAELNTFGRHFGDFVRE